MRHYRLIQVEKARCPVTLLYRVLNVGRSGTTHPRCAGPATAIFEWIELWYNRWRRYSALGYRSLIAAEEVLLLQDHAV